MDDTTFVAVNGPVSLTGILINIFFSYCLLCPGEEKEFLKQPLKVLLTLLVTYNFIVHITTVLSIILVFFPAPPEVTVTLIFVSVISAFSTMSSCVWLRIFYFTKIVPAHHVFSMWIKRNIKTIVYCSLIMDKLYHILEVSYAAVTFASLRNVNFAFSSTNETLFTLNRALYSNCTFAVLQTIYMAFYTGLMTLAGIATLAYLCGHMRRIESSDKMFSSTRLKSHLRVTIMGIVQTCLQSICFLLLILGWFQIEYLLSGYRVIQTVYSLFSFGTIVNLGFGQSLLRKRAADMFDRACETVKNI